MGNDVFSQQTSVSRALIRCAQELMAGGTLKALLVDAYYSTLDHRLFSRQVCVQTDICEA